VRAFAYYIPTRLFFGAGETQRIGTETSGIGRKALLVSGRDSARGSGLLGRVADLLRDAGVKVLELPGVDPNPKLSTCLKGAEICRREGIDVIVAVGGGSVVDAAKTTAAAALDPGDIWDVFLHKRQVSQALPLVALVTLAATGSELNPHSVIINEQTGQKFSLHSELVYPRVSILDPELTVSVPREHTVYGAVDIMAHALEGYVTAEGESALSDATVEGLCRCVMEATHRVLADPADLDARSDLLWCSTVACSGLAGAGYGTRYYDGHQIGHELSAAYGLAHGATLSVLLPGVMRVRLESCTPKLARLARRVFDANGRHPGGEAAVARAGIEGLKAWCAEAGAPVSLQQLGVPERDFPAIARRVLANPEAQNLSEADVVEILSASLQ
jgi:alcohol dehydrogenase YqhD (iron-dependent ADH family)